VEEKLSRRGGAGAGVAEVTQKGGPARARVWRRGSSGRRGVWPGITLRAHACVGEMAGDLGKEGD
jgi:hypothetical protein